MPKTEPTPLANAGRLASYLTVGVTGSLLANAQTDAAVVMINLTNVQGNNITGTNGGVAAGTVLTIGNWLGSNTGTLEIYNGGGPYAAYVGLDGDGDGSVYLEFAVLGSGDASPNNFGSGSTIGSSASWTGNAARTVFNYPGEGVSANFGAGSFMGFRFGSGSSWNYGYFEVTWTASTNTFQILSGAYESTANTGITTPTASAVPGGGVSAMALMALGGGAFRRRSRGRVA